MSHLSGQNVIVTGGSRGLGLGIVEALVRKNARVTVVARSAEPLARVGQRLGVATVCGDASDGVLAKRLLSEIRPTTVVLHAASLPFMGSLRDLTWEAFSSTWNSDVKATFQWVQEILRLPLPRGSRVLLASSGAAVGGSPRSGGYAGAKRMIWFMATYANGVAAELDLGTHFQAIVPRQMIGATEHGQVAASHYADAKGISVETFLEGFGKPMTPADVGEHVVTILTDPRYESGVAFGLKGDAGITSLDA